MKVQGSVFKDGGFWLAKVPVLDAMTQGVTEDDALVMVKDLVETLADRPGFSVTVHSRGNGDIELSSNDPCGMVALIERRQRRTRALAATAPSA